MLKATTLSTPQALLRGVFYCLAALALACCESKKQNTPDWSQQAETSKSEPAPGAKEQNQQVALQSTAQPDGSETVLMVYNLRNYLNMARSIGGVESQRPKPAQEVADLISNILKVRPDVLGVSEIGTQADLEDLQHRLSKAGLSYPHIHLSEGSDPRRRLAVLSQIPLETHPAPDLSFLMDGKKHLVSRGISDVSLSTSYGPVRLLGVHLKSKRPSKYWNQELIRRHESQVVRRHVDSILQQPNQRLLVYGDFNDTKQSPTIRSIKGNRNDTSALRAIDLKASDGSLWTHHWDYQDVYSRFDYVFTSAAMNQSVLREKCYILDIAPGDTASDHRPLVITFQ